MSDADQRAERRRPPIAVPIFALVLAATFAAAVALFAVTFNGPPPRRAPVAMEDLAEALKQCGAQSCPASYRPKPFGPPPDAARRPDPPGGAGFGPPPGGGFGPPGGDGPSDFFDLRLSASRQAPTPGSGERADAVRAAAIARLLNVPSERVIAYVSEQPPDLRLFVVGSATVGWDTGAGWRTVRTPAQPLFSRWHLVTLAVMLGTLAVLSLLGWLLARAIARPLAGLASAAADARVGVALPAMPSAGTREVAVLARALGDMHARLSGHAEGRTAMLAAIAHDLGTPLSRLAFRAEKLPEPARGRAAADIEEMRGLIAAAIGFARDEVGPRADTRVDLASLIESLADDMAEDGAAITVMPGPRCIVRGDPGALRRLFTNLIDNAVRYGGSAAIAWDCTAGTAEIRVDDHGPGIDVDQAERLFEPFVRGDPSRSRATGGSGLGLAIVRTLARRHGGEVTLANRAAGGARATVTLPLSR